MKRVFVLLILIFLTGCSNVQTGETTNVSSKQPVFVNTQANEAIITTGNTPGNINNIGLVEQKDGWIYYSNYSDNEYLYKMRTDGTEKTKLNSETSAYINVVGDWVYFEEEVKDSRPDDGSDRENYWLLYKIRIDGTDKTKLSNDRMGNLNIVGDWIYYKNCSDEARLYKIHTDGTSKTEITEDQAGFINVVGDWIYYTNYSDEWYLYKIKTDGSSKMQLNNYKSREVDVIGDWIYFVNMDDSFYIYKIRINGEDETILVDNETAYINIVGDWIYYNNYDDNKYLYKVRTDGSNRIRLNCEASYCLNVLGDWIYYTTRNDDNIDYLNKIRTDGTEKQLVD